MKDDFFSRLNEWWESVMRQAPRIAVALLVIIGCIFLGRLVKKLLNRGLVRISGKLTTSSLIARIAQIAIIITGLVVSLDILNLNHTVSSLLAGAGIIGIILGFALQDITANFISGIYITFKKPFDIGHTIKTNDYIGNVEQIHLRSTTIRTFSGLHLIIPNRDIIQKPLINYSLTRERRIELVVYIEGHADIEKAVQSIYTAMSAITYFYPGKPVEIYFNDFRDNAIQLDVWFWIDNHGLPGYKIARHDAIAAVMKGLNEAGVRLALPVTIKNKE